MTQTRRSRVRRAVAFAAFSLLVALLAPAETAQAEGRDVPVERVADTETVAPVPADASQLQPVVTESARPLDPARAAAGAVCHDFLLSSLGLWPLPMYWNGDGLLQFAWQVPDEVTTTGTWVRAWLDDSPDDEVYWVGTGQVFMDILTSDADDEPDGYALNPGPHALHAVMIQDGVACAQTQFFGAWPPPIDISAEGAPFWEYPTRTETIQFEQKFLVDTDVTDVFWMSDGPHLINTGFGTYTIGSTAEAGEDFAGPATPWPVVTDIVFPAHEQTVDVDITIIDDDCPENTERIRIHAMYDFQAQNWPWLVHWAPSWDFLILDDDDFKPPCFDEYEVEKEVAGAGDDGSLAVADNHLHEYYLNQRSSGPGAKAGR